VCGEALDEESHGDDEADAHEEDTVPVGRNPLSDGEECVLVEQQVFQAHQGTLRVHLSAFKKDIAVSLEIITGGTGP